MIDKGEARDIPLDRLDLNLANPRHEEVGGRDEAMIELLENEQILELARDIVDLGGINPMERLGVFPIEGTGKREKQRYSAAEGNRRLCALILLDDPETVPAAMPNRARYVRTFTQLSKKIDPIVTIPAVVFKDMDSARPWLERLHNGGRDGTGRRRWTPEQQARNTGDITNRGAAQILDLAIALNIATAAGLSRTTTTQQRFISNARFRQVMGLVRLESGDLQRTSCWGDFLRMLTVFIGDIVSGKINSRSHNNSRQIEDYAQTLTQLDGLTLRGVPQGDLSRRQNENDSGIDDEADGPKPDRNKQEPEGDEDEDEDHDDSDDRGDPNGKPKPRKRSSIGANDQVVAALHRLKNDKLIDLYQSIATVRIPQHTLLAVVGCWSFLESMTRAHGRNDTTAFDAYINAQVKNLGVENSPEKGTRRISLDWISQGGNVTKHDWQGAGYDPKQLYNAMDALNPIIVAVLDDISDKAGQ